MKYCEYFNLLEEYFPCIDESAINAGVDWKKTYPHESFIKLLHETEQMLSGSSKRALWINGAYGTGKSQCAYALRCILNSSIDEVQFYWEKYKALEKEKILLEKILGYKKQGIVTAFRYGSGSINSPQQFFFAIQESVKIALEDNHVSYMGENTLKNSVIAWLQKGPNNTYITSLLQEPRWKSLFSQETANEIIETLQKRDDVFVLMNNIFTMAAEVGVTALNITAESLKNWLKDIITKNNIKIVFIWDEFSDYFRQNKNSLGDFQNVISLCQETPFYFVMVTHPLSSVSQNDESWKIVQQRFVKVDITLPNSVAYELIAHSFDVKPQAKADWERLIDELRNNVSTSAEAVAKACDIDNRSIIESILPIHPIAALVLKNVATGFQANQRSMFEFVKSKTNDDTKAFQWFIANTTNLSDRPLLTVDMLWDFIYEKGKDSLQMNIKGILDTYPISKDKLTLNESYVLKTILLLQAMDTLLNGQIKLLKATEQNIRYAFEGDDFHLYESCINIAQSLVKKGILIFTRDADSENNVYSSAIFTGDQGQITKIEGEVRAKISDVKQLISNESIKSKLGSVLNLSSALILRFSSNQETGEIPIVTYKDFQKALDIFIQTEKNDWQFQAFLAIATNEEESLQFRALIQKTIVNEKYKGIIIIDALSAPFGLETMEQYIEYSALSQYYQGKNDHLRNNYNHKANELITNTWYNNIQNSSFIVYSYEVSEGEKATGCSGVQSILKEYVLKKYRHTIDFTLGLTSSQLKLSQASKSARQAMGDIPISGIMKDCEKKVLAKVWSNSLYWELPSIQDDPIVIFKKAIDSFIQDAFKNTGKVSIDDIRDYLQEEFGLSDSNLTAFVMGFLLKEYGKDPYRYQNTEGHREAMSFEKLSEMIGNSLSRKAKTTYIVNLTDEEKAFYNLIKMAWDINEQNCSSPQAASSLISIKMKELGFPVWVLQEVDSENVYDILEEFIKLVQHPGNEAHDIANSIGIIAMNRSSIASPLKSLLTKENCKKGMIKFLNRYKEGIIFTLANRFTSDSQVLEDVKNKFDIQYSALWDKTTGEDQIDQLIEEYEVIYLTNDYFNSKIQSKEGALKLWKEFFDFSKLSCELLQQKYPQLQDLFTTIKKYAKQTPVLPEDISKFLQQLHDYQLDIHELIEHTQEVFNNLYAPYLQELSVEEKVQVRAEINTTLFLVPGTQSNAAIKNAVTEFKKGQLKTQLFSIWKEKTDSKNPKNWSRNHRTPILSCIPEENQDEARRLFLVFDKDNPSENDIQQILDFIENQDFFKLLQNPSYCDQQFKKYVLKDYALVLKDLDYVRSILEETKITPYDWGNSSTVENKIKELALAEYNSGASDSVVESLSKMSPVELQQWLTDIVKKDMGLGLKILLNKKD